MIKDILYYIKKSGVINSKYVSWNSYVVQNDHLFFFDQIYRLDLPSLKSKPFLFFKQKLC